MTTPPNTPTRWRPRFSVRTLVVIVTLVCAYAACWGPTKRTGVRDVLMHVIGAESPASDRLVTTGIPDAALPLVVATYRRRYRLDQTMRGPDHLVAETRVYYSWFFGYVAKLPYEREL